MALTSGPKDSSDTYALAVGEQGAARLDVMDSLINQSTRHYLVTAGLSVGQTVIDIGCGSGAVSNWIAQEVGAEGKVYGIDISEAQLAIATQKSLELGLSNIEYAKKDVLQEELSSLPKADIVHIRCLLMHLKDPSIVLTKAKDLLKPGGKIVCQEPITSSAYSVPEYQIFQNLNDALMKISECFGVDYDIGERLGDHVLRAGFTGVTTAFSQQKAKAAPMKSLLGKGIPECKAAAIQAQAADDKTVDQWHQQIMAWDEQDDAFEYHLPRQAHVIGTKP